MNRGIIMCRSLRQTDMQGERIVKKFLIKYFYERIRKNEILPQIINYRSVDLIDSQLQGIDTILYLNNGTSIVIDEKCALKYINTDLSTFAFEIQWNRKGETAKGWLVNRDLQTQYYFVMWLRGRQLMNPRSGAILSEYDYVKQMSVETITSIELFAINKNSLLKYLDDIGLSIEQMEAKANWLVENNTKKHIVNADIKYFYSEHLAEKPVNIVISKNLLKRIADAIYDISPDQVKRNGRIIYEASKKL